MRKEGIHTTNLQSTALSETTQEKNLILNTFRKTKDLATIRHTVSHEFILMLSVPFVLSNLSLLLLRHLSNFCPFSFTTLRKDKKEPRNLVQIIWLGLPLHGEYVKNKRVEPAMVYEKPN